jgi:hypothetical protein
MQEKLVGLLVFSGLANPRTTTIAVLSRHTTEGFRFCIMSGVVDTNSL